MDRRVFRCRRFLIAIFIASPPRKTALKYVFGFIKSPTEKSPVFDACEICGSVGFYKGPNGVVCKNCAAPINGQSVGTKGGCNPIPLAADQTATAVIIKEADIAAGAHYFQQ